MRQDGSFAKNGITCARLSARRTITSPLRLTGCTWKTFLARSMPTVVISIVVAPSSCCVTAPLWRCDAGSGSHPPHLLLSLELRKRTSSSIVGTVRFDPKLTRDPRGCTPRENLAQASGSAHSKRGGLLQLLGNLLSLLIALDHSRVVRRHEGIKLREVGGLRTVMAAATRS